MRKFLGLIFFVDKSVIADHWKPCFFRNVLALETGMVEKKNRHLSASVSSTILTPLYVFSVDFMFGGVDSKEFPCFTRDLIVAN
jgi:hypothetical protein